MFAAWTRRLALRRRRAPDFRSNITAAILAICGLALLVACSVLLTLQYRADRRDAAERHEQLARVLADSVSAAVVFDDRAATRETLAHYMQVPRIRGVRIARGDGTTLAYAGAAGQASIDDPTLSRIATPVVVDGETVGTAMLVVENEKLSALVSHYLGIGALVFSATFALAYLLSGILVSIVARPLGRLAGAMDAIGRSRDYSRRVEGDPDPQFGRIIESFNAMLVEVEQRDHELAQNAAALAEARDAAEAANRAKSLFLANMTHELRTPLNAIIGYAEVLAQELAETGETQNAEDADWIFTSARHLLEMINSILDLSKAESGRLELDVVEFDVAELLGEVETTLRPLAAARSNRLIVRSHLEASHATNDATKIRQILLNLGANACKFTECGHVVITAATVDENSRDWLLFTVADTGIGISEQQLARLFEPFVQADASTTRRHGGTGLGLAISAHMAAVMQGAITVESRVGAGSTFILKVPATIDPTDRRAAA